MIYALFQNRVTQDPKNINITGLENMFKRKGYWKETPFV
jgi:hypothetical protein